MSFAGLVVAGGMLLTACGSEDPAAVEGSDSTMSPPASRPADTAGISHGTTNGIDATDGEVTGLVMAIGHCPGPRRCEPIPVSGTVVVLRAADVIASASIERDGGYRLVVRPGDYELTVRTTQFPSCASVAIKVAAGTSARVDLVCESAMLGP